MACNKGKHIPRVQERETDGGDRTGIGGPQPRQGVALINGRPIGPSMPAH